MGTLSKQFHIDVWLAVGFCCGHQRIKSSKFGARGARHTCVAVFFEENTAQVAAFSPQSLPSVLLFAAGNVVSRHLLLLQHSSPFESTCCWSDRSRFSKATVAEAVDHRQ